ncbi:MAG: sigma-70 family RNA polymerase sigma factor [Hyphomicrobiales bacterium]|nr:sigma-70 family RNA polymerase sigma factor [Rickettsiales bacterium]MCP5362281.1 sigma-70 family RNA polymerase sigma factor [Hyphomicrobiales bacterium]
MERNRVPHWKEQEDHALLLAIQDGSHPAFAELVARHSTRFYRLAFRYTAERTSAEDITQMAFLKLWEKPTMWDATRNNQFTTWFYRIVANLCLDWQKKKKPLTLAEDYPVADHTASQEEQLAMTQEQRLLEAEIADLPERQRTALNLCFYEGVSNQEAADIMGINLKALQSLVMRAKTRLKERLQPTIHNEAMEKTA